MDGDLGPTTRRARRGQRIGVGACCRCGEADPLVLQHTAVGIECGSCEAERTTGRRTEAHHPAGRANLSITVALDANTHARLSDAQRDWPTATLRNSGGSEPRRVAAMLRALVDSLRVVILPAVPTVEELIGQLEALDEDQER